MHQTFNSIQSITMDSSLLNLSSLEDVLRAYDTLCSHEKQVESEISELYEKHHELESKMKAMKKEIPNMVAIVKTILTK